MVAQQDLNKALCQLAALDKHEQEKDNG
jgi:hypothetical protein